MADHINGNKPKFTRGNAPASERATMRCRASWREAAIIGRLDRGYWRAEFPGGGSGMFKEADIRAYDGHR